MNTEQLVKYTVAEEAEELRGNTSQYLVVHHESNMICPEIVTNK
jgi:hypothetical protein